MANGLPQLTSEFADRFPALCVDWAAASAPDPEVVWVNDSLAHDLAINPSWLRTAEGKDWLTGKSVSTGSKPVAQVYAGHQFGHYSPRLGDGRALLLGEVRDKSGLLRDVHLKGAGPTPFARGGDGFAALGPMLREAVMGEAMHALGVKTTRALAVIKTGRWVVRDGDPLPAALLVRVAASHLRVGTFQFVRSTGDVELLQDLVQYSLQRHYDSADGGALSLLREVVGRQAELVASWMLVGFVHGVVNTDNVTISGETIDYGPCAMLDSYDESAVFSSIDREGRYSYRNQPPVTHWNMVRFAESLLPLLGDTSGEAVESAEAELREFTQKYEAAFERGLAKKLGDSGLPAASVFDSMRSERADFTMTFRDLSSANPLYIPRNHLLEEALNAAEDGYLLPFEELMSVIVDPFTARPGLERYAEPPPADSPRFITTCGT